MLARTPTIKLVRVRGISIWVGNYAYLFHGIAFLFMEALDNNDFSRFLGNGLGLAYVTKFNLVRYRI